MERVSAMTDADPNALVLIETKLVEGLVSKGFPESAAKQFCRNLSPALLAEFNEMIFRRVEAVSSMIVRRVRVDRKLTSREALKATGRKLCGEKYVIDTMPQGEGDEVDVYLFKPSPYVEDVDFYGQFEFRGLKPVDPFSLAALNADHPNFADDYLNFTQWKDTNGDWLYAAFGRWGGQPGVHVKRYGGLWTPNWWCAGLLK